MDRVQSQVEELPENRVRLTVQVPSHDVHHAVEHAADDLAQSVKVPGFRKGKVPRQVLLQRVGHERLMTEAVESHIGGWFWNAAARSRVRPVAQPEYDFELPASDDEDWEFTATVAVQAKPELPDWKELEVGAAEVEVPEELVQAELDALRATVAELVPVEGRPVGPDDTVIVDLVVRGRDAARLRRRPRPRRRRGGGRAGPRRDERRRDEGDVVRARRRLDAVPLRDGQGDQGEGAAAARRRPRPRRDRVRDASPSCEPTSRRACASRSRKRSRHGSAPTRPTRSSPPRRCEAAGPLVESRTRELLRGFARQVEARGVSLETFLAMTGQPPEELVARLSEEAQRSVARELVLDAVADQLGIDVPDAEVEELVREQAEALGDDTDEMLVALRESGRFESLRDDLRLRKALDHVAGEVKRIPLAQAEAREAIWTPDKEKPPTETKLWTPDQPPPDQQHTEGARS